MKKILFIAIALVAGVLAFTSCNKKDKDKGVDSPIVGTWSIIEEDMDYFITFDGEGNYTYINDYYMYGRDAVPHEHVVIKGSFTVDGDIITVHNDSETISMDGGPAEEIEWEPYDEQMKYSINGNTLHLIRQYGTEYSWEEDWTKQ